MSIFGKLDTLNDKSIILPTEELLRDLSFRCSYAGSTNKLAVTKDIVDIVIADAHAYETVISERLDTSSESFRVKTPDSIIRKIEKHPDRNFQSLFNDILGLRIFATSYPDEFPNYFRVVDMRNGKKHDDGYRGIHLYYKLDNYHYIIEIQIWAGNDIDFNSWSHASGYKTLTDEQLKYLRRLYDSGEINSYSDFMKERSMF